MERADAVIAIFADHQSAQAAIKSLIEAGFDMTRLSVLGKAYHVEEKIIDFDNIIERIRFWGARGTFWQGLRGVLFGGLFVTIPVVEPVVVPGLSGRHAALYRRGRHRGWWAVNALGAALHGIGVPEDSVGLYKADLKDDGVLVMAHGATDDMARAKAVLGATTPARLDVHAGVNPIKPLEALIPIQVGSSWVSG